MGRGREKVKGGARTGRRETRLGGVDTLLTGPSRLSRGGACARRRASRRRWTLCEEDER
jgi:hypothetical protein